MSDDVRRRVAEAPITPFQVAAIAVAVCLNMLDGFDILAMSFAASGVKSDWQLSDGQLGYLFSAGLFGMAIGSLCVAPWADRLGRRPVILISLALSGIAMLGSAVAPDYRVLFAWRLFTGIGIGGTIASVAVIVSEYAPDRWRSVALGLYATGYSIGATVGGLLTTLAIGRFGWRSAFAIGGLLSLGMLPVAAWRLPESLDFLLVRQPARALERINRLLAGLRQPPASALPANPPIASRAAERLASQIAPLVTPTTALAWCVFFSTMAGFYFIVSWTPRLLVAAGMSTTQGLTGGVLLNLGGIAGCGLYAWATSRVDALRLLFVVLVATALLVCGFGLAFGLLSVALGTAVLLGMMANAAMAGLYAVGPTLYPAVVRATGMGTAIGIGRAGAILAPLVSGALLDGGWAPRNLYLLFAIPFAVAAVAALGMETLRRASASVSSH
jgi:benzoate transport